MKETPEVATVRTTGELEEVPVFTYTVRKKMPGNKRVRRVDQLSQKSLFIEGFN